MRRVTAILSVAAVVLMAAGLVRAGEAQLRWRVEDCGGANKSVPELT